MTSILNDTKEKIAVIVNYMIYRIWLLVVNVKQYRWPSITMITLQFSSSLVIHIQRYWGLTWEVTLCEWSVSACVIADWCRQLSCFHTRMQISYHMTLFPSHIILTPSQPANALTLLLDAREPQEVPIMWHFCVFPAEVRIHDYNH